MNVWQSLTDIPGNEASVVTIGNFDGMHNGHKKVIATCVDRAHKLGVDAIAITFDPHPIQVHRPEAGAFAHGQAPRRSRAQLTQWAAEAGYAPQAAPEEETPPIAAVSPSGEVLGLLRIDGTRLRTVLVF